MVRKRVIYRGVVQGVGFRPTVYRCALACGLSGFVQNQRSVVMAEFQGDPSALEKYSKLFAQSLPGAAKLESVNVTQIKPVQETGFTILESATADYTFPPIPADLAVCGQCRTELFDPKNRRYLYPFITCTQCGPRYSVVEDTPFDRETTSMRDFNQCDSCLMEYRSPEDRRFHSQTNSCSVCGPSLSLVNSAGSPVSGDPVLQTIAALKDGKIVAVQGIGGFHLAASPEFRKGIVKLRQDKERERKPFALMARSIAEAEALCHFDDLSKEVLLSSQSPILIESKRDSLPENYSLISDVGTLGLMLPYTPLHLLLFFHPEIDIPYHTLIMTSGNLKGQPIESDPKEALKRLSGIADLFLYHNRRILFRTDDSILRRDMERGHCTIRRSRGFVPEILTLNREIYSSALAVGGDLKNAPAFATGSDIYLAPYIGDLEDPITRRDFEHQIEKILTLYDIRPKALLFDLHPGYFSHQWAVGQDLECKVGVQHHHAHVLSVMAEHDLDEVLGLAFDGTGYGLDGKVWGGEFLHSFRGHFTRVGSFSEFPLPGGEAAIRHPIRIALSLLLGTRDDGEGIEKIISEQIDRDQQAFLTEMIHRGVNSPMTTSLGRIFDAAAALLGIVSDVSYEGEGPIKLEGYAWKGYDRNKRLDRSVGELVTLNKGSDDSIPQLDPSQLIRFLAEGRRNESPIPLAFLFHEAIASAVINMCLKLRDTTGLNRLALSGGVFQNMLFRRLLIPELDAEEFHVYVNRKIPPGDGGLAVGQIYFDTRSMKQVDFSETDGSLVYKP